jgi:hypothetical protein
MSRAVMQQALDALENHAGNYKLSNEGCDKHGRACESLRAELAKPEPTTDQSVFEDWLESKCPSGDNESVQRQWESSSEYRDCIAKPEQDAIDAYRKIIKALAELVTMPQTDKQYKSDVLSRPAVMDKVTSIRYHAYALFQSAHTVITEARK